MNILTNEPEGPPPDYVAEKALFQYKLERNEEKLKSMKEIMDMKNAEIEVRYLKILQRPIASYIHLPCQTRSNLVGTKVRGVIIEKRISWEGKS